MSSVQPLQLTFSFTANRAQATDKVDLAQLNAAFATVTAKLNEIKTALDVTLGPDNTLKDGSIAPRHFSDEVDTEIAGKVNTAYLTANP